MTNETRTFAEQAKALTTAACGLEVALEIAKRDVHCFQSWRRVVGDTVSSIDASMSAIGNHTHGSRTNGLAVLLNHRLGRLRVSLNQTYHETDGATHFTCMSLDVTRFAVNELRNISALLYNVVIAWIDYATAQIYADREAEASRKEVSA